MRSHFFLLGFILFLLLGSCKEKCLQPDKWPSSYDINTLIIGVKVDTLNGGYSIQELDSILLVHSETDTLGKTPPFGFSQGVYYYNIGFRIYTNTREIVLRDLNVSRNYSISIEYEKFENDCDEAYSVKTFLVNGIQRSGMDTLYIN